MTKDQFSLLLSSIQSAELQVREDGHKEYAHSDSNVFANFDRVADSLKLDRKQVLLVYALKHWDGIVSYVGGHVSQREDVRGRIKDLRMYLALLWGMIEDKETTSVPPCHEYGCGCENKVEVTTHADGPDNRKFIPYIREAEMDTIYRKRADTIALQLTNKDKCYFEVVTVRGDRYDIQASSEDEAIRIAAREKRVDESFFISCVPVS